MTATVGIFCKNGVVIGTDSSATFGNGSQLRTIEQPTNKICLIDNKIIIAGTGSVGFGQRFCDIVKRTWEGKQFQKPAIEIVKQLSHLFIKDIAVTFSKPGQYGALVAFPAEKNPYLCEFTIHDFQPEFKTKDLWYCSMGGTQPITDPFLGFIREVYWADSLPDLNEGIFAAVWTLDHAIRLNPGGVNGPIRIAILESKKGQYYASEVSDEELHEHRQNIEDVKNKLREFRLQHKGIPAEQIPDVPKLT